MDNRSEFKNHNLVFEVHVQPTKWQDYFKQNVTEKNYLIADQDFKDPYFFYYETWSLTLILNCGCTWESLGSFKNTDAQAPTETSSITVSVVGALPLVFSTSTSCQIYLFYVDY